MSEGPRLIGVPRWIQVPAGLFLLVSSGLSALGSVALMASPPESAPLLATLLCVAMLGISVWGLLVAARLILGRPRRDGGLLSPLALLGSAVVFAAIPIGWLATGMFQDARSGWLLLLGTLAYFAVAATAYRLASARSSRVNDDLDRAIHLLISDIRATIGRGHRTFVLETAANVREFTADSNEGVLRLVEEVQQHFHDCFIDTTWPPCPRHPNHPLWFRSGAWYCERDGAQIAKLGDLGSTRAA